MHLIFWDFTQKAAVSLETLFNIVYSSAQAVFEDKITDSQQDNNKGPTAG